MREGQRSNIIKFPTSEDVDRAIADKEPLLVLISFDGKTVIMCHIDKAMKHHILLLKAGVFRPRYRQIFPLSAGRGRRGLDVRVPAGLQEHRRQNAQDKAILQRRLFGDVRRAPADGVCGRDKHTEALPQAFRCIKYKITADLLNEVDRVCRLFFTPPACNKISRAEFCRARRASRKCRSDSCAPCPR